MKGGPELFFYFFPHSNSSHNFLDSKHAFVVSSSAYRPHCSYCLIGMRCSACLTDRPQSFASAILGNHVCNKHSAWSLFSIWNVFKTQHMIANQLNHVLNINANWCKISYIFCCAKTLKAKQPFLGPFVLGWMKIKPFGVRFCMSGRKKGSKPQICQLVSHRGQV